MPVGVVDATGSFDARLELRSGERTSDALVNLYFLVALLTSPSPSALFSRVQRLCQALQLTKAFITYALDASGQSISFCDASQTGIHQTLFRQAQDPLYNHHQRLAQILEHLA